MSDDKDEEKEYEPTQKKLDDARKKGEIAKSMDLVTAAAYAGVTLAALTAGASSIQSLGATLQLVLGQSDKLVDLIFTGSPQVFFSDFLKLVMLSVSAWFAFPLAATLIALIGQNAIVFAPSKLKAKGSRISLISGLKNKLGRQGFFEFFKSFAKLLIYGTVLGIYLALQSERLIGTLYLHPEAMTVELGRLIIGLMAIVVGVASTLAVFDYIWQTAEHTRKNRMSRKEIMDEMKQSEGDPMMKQQRRQRGYEITMSRMLEEVPNADVVIVNPTHYAVVLSWDRQPGSAPICVAKGVDNIAAKIREIAIENGVPIHSDPPTARAIHATVEVGCMIEISQFAAVAAAIRFSEKIRMKVRESW